MSLKVPVDYSPIKSPRDSTSLLAEEFRSRYDGGVSGDIMAEDKVNDPRVFIDRSGDMMRLSELSQLIDSKLPEKILEWFTTGKFIEDFFCNGHEFRLENVVVDFQEGSRYVALWQEVNENPQAKSFESLIKDKKLAKRRFALIPESLAKMNYEIEKEQKEDTWEKKKWIELSKEIREGAKKQLSDLEKVGYGRMKATYHKELKNWDRRRREALPGRTLPKDIRGFQTWTIFRKALFIARLTYHFAVATLFEYGLRIARAGNFISPKTQIAYRKSDIGERLAPLFLEYYGMRYNQTAKNIVEQRFWKYLNGY